ncbi:MAG: stage V sporulation protein AE [Thermoanaerobacterales bacterium]|nr:stage V sporulation protein AE [Bacillota bacterium]MDI6906325.1 stage V sporulation protein AE [Thermoanaerobacterales bacterium]
MIFLKAFIIGGLFCAIGQLLMDLTNYKVTPAHILVGFVTAGVIISGLGLYQPLVDFAGAGATVPLTGFGHLLAQGSIKGAQQQGLIGAFTGGLATAAPGITAAVVFGYLTAVIFRPKG